MAAAATSSATRMIRVGAILLRPFQVALIAIGADPLNAGGPYGCGCLRSGIPGRIAMPHAGRLWRVRWVSTSSQLVRCGKDSLLQVVEQILAGRGPGGCARPGPRRGLPQQGVARRGGPRR